MAIAVGHLTQSNMKLLVIDDDTKLSVAVSRGLRAEGFAVEVAHTGDDGLWMATESSYDLIILDVMLPGLDGYQVCSKLRAAGDWTPILMLTAMDEDLDEAEGLDLGADDYLTKPFSFSGSGGSGACTCSSCCLEEPSAGISRRPSHRAQSATGVARRGRDLTDRP